MFVSETPMVRSRLKVLLDQRNIARLQSGLSAQSMRQFARECGLPPSVITNLVANNVTRADFGTLDKLCRALDVTPGDILEYVNE